MIYAVLSCAHLPCALSSCALLQERPFVLHSFYGAILSCALMSLHRATKKKCLKKMSNLSPTRCLHEYQNSLTASTNIKIHKVKIEAVVLINFVISLYFKVSSYNYKLFPPIWNIWSAHNPRNHNWSGIM